MFGRRSGRKNLGFESDSGRNSVISVASEEREEHREKEKQKVDEDDGKEITEMEKENEKVEESMEEDEQKQEDVASQSSFEISVTVHTKTFAATELNESRAEIDHSDGAIKRSLPPTTEADQPGTSSSYSRLEEEATTQGGQHDNHTTDQITGSMDITEDKRANVTASTATDTDVVIEMKDVGMSLHSESSTSVEIDVTDMTSEDANQTSF